MIFQSTKKYSAIKAILISASSCSGKSYVLRTISDEEDITDLHIFEMDSIKYWISEELNQRLPVAQQKFDEWSIHQKESVFLEELRSNIKFSEEHVQLIKLKFIELMNRPEQFMTVLPYAMRYESEEIRFIELLEEYFECQIVHVAIIPSIARYGLNLHYRKQLRDFDYVKRVFDDRKLLISKKDDFDNVIEIPLWRKEKKFIETLGQYIK